MKDSNFAPQRRKERKGKARFVCFCHDQVVISNFFGFLCVLCVFAVQNLGFYSEFCDITFFDLGLK
jgi:hypothetical protein